MPHTTIPYQHHRHTVHVHVMLPPEMLVLRPAAAGAVLVQRGQGRVYLMGMARGRHRRGRLLLHLLLWVPVAGRHDDVRVRRLGSSRLLLRLLGMVLLGLRGRRLLLVGEQAARYRRRRRRRRQLLVVHCVRVDQGGDCGG